MNGLLVLMRVRVVIPNQLSQVGGACGQQGGREGAVMEWRSMDTIRTIDSGAECLTLACGGLSLS